MNPISAHPFATLGTARWRTVLPRRALGTLASILAMAPAYSQVPATQAQEDDDAVVLDAITVSTVRGSLIQAQDIKQNQLVFIDSIVAQDIGKFPDNTVADALQRIPGIQVARGAGEVSTVLIRGLPNFATTLNSQEIFTGTGRGVALQDLPAELIAGVDVYKSNAPDQVEGGIAGLIDIRLRKPLDSSGLEVGVGGRGIYSDNSEKFSYVGSALVSNRWMLENGSEFGALFAASRSKGRYQDQTIFNFDWLPRDTTAVPGETQVVWPSTVGSLLTPQDRDRTAYNLSLQWKPNEQLELYTDVLYTAYRNEHDVHFFIGIPSGEVLSATLVPGTNVAKTVTFRNGFHLSSQQAFDDKTDSYHAVFGGKWTNDDITVRTEYIYNWSSVKTRAVILDTKLNDPAGDFAYDFNKDYDGRADVVVSGPTDIRNGENYTLWGLFDNHSYATSEQHAFKTDLEKEVKQGFVSSIQGGLRVSQRDARNRATNVQNVEPLGGRGVVSTATIPGLMTQAPDAKGDFSVENWANADADFLRNNAGRIRELFGRPSRDPDFDPTQSFTDTEKTYAAYAQARYETEVGGLPLDGLFGVRIVKTEQELEGNLPNGTPIQGDKSDTEILPTLNGRLKLGGGMQLRASAGRAITRPGFAQLNPVVSLVPPTTTGTAFGTGSGGNPELESVRSDNYDLAFEYYFGEASYVAVGGFYRSIEGYVQNFASVETIDGIGYNVTRPRNSGKGELHGVELTYQHFPEFLPESLKGLGLMVNFTYIDGDQDVADESPGAPVGARTRQPFAQVSKYNYNVVAIYEKGRFSSRLAYTWRGKYIETFNVGVGAAGSPLRVLHVADRGQLDFSASF
ncbi:MAG TPA: TonB-dependent receptor, partial [Candidatus Synoicihabitans sp.]|nr:TonB-dependent receptor [Candidatus Synoicihabitans sp.]